VMVIRGRNNRSKNRNREQGKIGPQPLLVQRESVFKIILRGIYLPFDLNLNIIAVPVAV
jgi:hypothetical protein